MSMHPGAGRSTTIFRRSCWLCGGDSPISGERAKLPRGYTASRCIPAFRLSAAGCGVRKACAFRSTWRATTIWQAREQLDELYAVISRLGRLDRALILLWLEERPAGEIAAITGLSPGNVAVKLTRIRCKLRKMYNR